MPAPERAGRQFAFRRGAQIGDGGDGDAAGGEVERGAVAGIAGGEDHGARARLHAPAIEIGPRRIRQHDAGAVIVREHQRALQRAGRQHHLAGAHLPEPLARQLRIGRGDMVGDALGERDHVVREIAERRGAGEQRDVVPRREARHGARQPVARRLALDGGAGLGEQRAAEFLLLVAQHHPRAALGGGQRRGKAGRAGADDEHVAMHVVLGVAVGIGDDGGAAEAGHGADLRLVEALPGARRPHEGLVVEARRQERRGEIVHRAGVELQRGPAVLALGHHAVMDLDLRGAQVRACSAIPRGRRRPGRSARRSPRR